MSPAGRDTGERQAEGPPTGAESVVRACPLRSGGGQKVEISFWDKLTPLKLAGRHTGLFPNEVKADVGEGTLADILMMAHELNRSG